MDSNQKNAFAPMTEQVVEIPLSQLHPFEGHPFKVQDDDAMLEMADSIRQYGVLVPGIVRPDPDGGYEMIACHRRHRASQLAGKETMPVIVRNMDDDAAIIIMVDTNLQRENILPSERAFAYKMKLDAMKHQGKQLDATSSQVGTKLRADEMLAQQVGSSRNQVQRYIRLTELIKPLLDMVDEKKIALNPAYELSFLKKTEQEMLLTTMDYEQATPSLSQAQRMKKMSQDGTLNEDTMLEVMSEVKKAEYAPLVERLHGQVIRISPTSRDYINPMDLNLDYSDDENPLSLKSDFILSLCELIVGGKDGLQPVQKTIIDRCVRLVYKDYLNDPRPEKMPILEDLYDLLRKQDEKEAQYIATALEIYVTGSLNVFNHRTTVNINNRIVCYDIKELGKQLKKIGMLVVQDQVWNRVTINRAAHKSTRYYIDEMHLLLKEEQTAAYTVEIWKRFRKWGGIPTGITQNVKDLLASREVEKSDVAVADRRHGSRAFRSSIASNMINERVPTEVVRRVLGHGTKHALKHYAKIDVESMRLCPLPVPEPSGSFAQLLSWKAGEDHV